MRCHIFASPSVVGESEAVGAFFNNSIRVSAVIVVSIETAMMAGANERIATVRSYLNSRAERPLSQQHMDALGRVDFNKWRYDFRREKGSSQKSIDFLRSSGSLGVRLMNDKVELTIPATILVDCLAGRAALKDQYRESSGATFLACIEDGWDVIENSFVPSNIEQGLSGMVKLVLVPPPERVFRG